MLPETASEGRTGRVVRAGGCALTLGALILGAFGPAAALGAPGQGSDNSGTAKARSEVTKARQLVDRSADAASAGDRERAYGLARTAYLDHFELAEIPLRLKDPNLVLDAEFSFAKFRNGIEGGDSQAAIVANARDVRRKLKDVDHVLASPGVAAPLLAAGFSFSIIFREGLEAVLILAVLLGALEAGRASGFRRPLIWGVGAALVATVVTWVIAQVALDVAPVDRELMAGIVGLLAVAVLFGVTFWLISRLEQRHWMEFMRSRVSTAIAAGSGLAFAGLGFTAVYREGFETVLFYQTLLIFAHGLWPWVLLGLGVGIAALGGVAWAILRLGKRLPIRAFLGVAAVIVLLMSVAFAGNAVSAMQDAGVLPITPIDSSALRLPVFLIDLTGIHATVQGLVAQGSLLVIYLAGASYLLLLGPMRRRRTVQRIEASA